MTTILRMRWFLSLVLMMGGCASTRVAGKPHLRVSNRSVDITEEGAIETVQKVLPYALMSELAYRDYDATGNVRAVVDEKSHSSDEKARKTLEAKKERAQGWSQLDSGLKEQQWKFQKHIKLACGANGLENLEFDIWINKAKHPREVVIAFRGTDDPSDWLSNLRGLLFFHRGKDQYARIRRNDFKDEVIAACRNAGPGVVVTATGHSLGGGLAQHLLYASQLWETNPIARVTVFDSSPMTGWYQLGKDRTRARERFNTSLASIINDQHWKSTEVMAHKYGFGTMRVNERGEVLAYARFLFRVFDHEDRFISVLNLNFVKGEAVRQHSMANLAFRLLYYPSLPPQPTPLGVRPH